MASRWHFSTMGLGTPGGLLVTFGLGRRAAFVAVLPDKPTDMVGADDSESGMVGARIDANPVTGADDSEAGMVGANDSENPLDGADPGPHNIVGPKEPDC